MKTWLGNFLKCLAESNWNVWQNPTDRPGMDLCSISTGATLSEDVLQMFLMQER